MTPRMKLHGEKTKLRMKASGKKAGRPTELTRNLLVQILRCRRFENERTWGPWGKSRIAKTLNITERRVTRALNLKVILSGGRKCRFMDLGFDVCNIFLRLERKRKGMIGDLLEGLADDE